MKNNTHLHTAINAAGLAGKNWLIFVIRSYQFHKDHSGKDTLSYFKHKLSLAMTM